MAKEALVVKSEILFKDKQFQGFLSSKEHDYFPTILSHFEYSPRGDTLEYDSSLQQVIPYVWIVNPKKKEVFAYRRATDKNYNEKRLRNKWSCGVGGHIDKEDAENPIHNAMMRELREEVNMPEYPLPKTIGYLNLNHDVHAVHFGIVAIAETKYNVFPRDAEMAEGTFYSINDLEKLFADNQNDIEEWTRQSWPHIKKYLAQN